MGFPDSSVGEESACSAGDPTSVPGSGRSAGEGISYPLQYSWASLVAQTVKNLPAIQNTRGQSLSREEPWRRKWQSAPVFLPGEFRGHRNLVDNNPWGCQESDMTEQLSTHTERIRKGQK